MKKSSGDNKIAFVLAILVHIVLFTFLFLKFKPLSQSTHSPSQNIIKAVMVKQPQQPIKPTAAPEPTVNELELVQQQAIAQQHQQEEMHLRKQKIAQQKTLKKQQAAEQLKLKLAEQADLLAQQQAQKQQQAALKKQQAQAAEQQKKLLQQKLAREQAEKVKQQKAIEAKLAKAKAAQELKKLQKLAAQKTQQQKAAQDLQQQLAAEESQLAVDSAKNARLQGEVDKYKGIILQAIGQQWIVPNTTKDISCKLRIRLAPGGVLLNVKLLRSSGDPALDRSAIAAVNKASPLPVPTDPAVFDQFREIDLTVHPNQ